MGKIHLNVFICHSNFQTKNCAQNHVWNSITFRKHIKFPTFDQETMYSMVSNGFGIMQINEHKSHLIQRKSRRKNFDHLI